MTAPEPEVSVSWPAWLQSAEYLPGSSEAAVEDLRRVVSAGLSAARGRFGAHRVTCPLSAVELRGAVRLLARGERAILAVELDDVGGLLLSVVATGQERTLVEVRPWSPEPVPFIIGDGANRTFRERFGVASDEIGRDMCRLAGWIQVIGGWRGIELAAAEAPSLNAVSLAGDIAVMGGPFGGSRFDVALMLRNDGVELGRRRFHVRPALPDALLGDLPGVITGVS